MTEQKKITAILYGVSSIGTSIAELAIKKRVEVVAAYDSDEKKQGVDLGKFLGIGRELGVKIQNNIEKVYADVAIHCTGSHISIAFPEITELLRLGYNVISTCEELVYPINENYTIAAEIDKTAIKNNVSVLATGANPGFILDIIPIFLSLACHDVKKVTAKSTVDPLMRSFEFQQKSGAGLTKEEFRERLESGDIKSPGLSESIAMIANSLGIEIDKIKERIEPVIAELEIVTDEITIAKGHISGKEQTAIAYLNGEERIVLSLRVVVNVREPCDEIIIEGTPNINVRIIDGLHVETATAGILVNMLPKIVDSKPGLRYMNEFVPHLHMS